MAEPDKNEKLLLPFLNVVAVLFLIIGGSVYLFQRNQLIKSDQSFYESMNALQTLGESFAEQSTSSNQASRKSKSDAIRKVLQTQQEAWNAGEIDSFMEHYWQSEELTFSSGGKVTRGWQATLDGYKQRYSSREQMGTLEFSDLEVSYLGEAAALVLGRWQLTREVGDLNGNFSLVFRRIDGQWLIVHDHTSKAETPSDTKN